jgi:hypothetical protein
MAMPARTSAFVWTSVPAAVAGAVAQVIAIVTKPAGTPASA